MLIPSRTNVLRGTFQVVRPVCVFLVAIVVAAAAIAVEGWGLSSAGLAVVITLIGGLLIMQVYRVIQEHRHHSAQLHLAAIRAEEHYVEVLRRIVYFVEGRDKYNEGHSKRVGELAVKIAHRLKLPPATCKQMELAGHLHDIGMMAIPGDILTRRSRLGVEAFNLAKKHPGIGYEVLEPLVSLRGILGAVRHHHERMNGTGYPSGLKGQDIPLSARIIAVADSYDAMTHDRPYRAAMSPMVAIRELRRCCPAGFDTRCVEALADIFHFSALKESMACATS